MPTAAGVASPATRSGCCSAGGRHGSRGPQGPGSEASLACSLVSSPGLEAVAQHYGLDFHTTLTGFKWISRAPGIVYGFEEALGYLVNPETVRDKDGISAAVAMLGMVTEARGRGESLADLLREFAETFGFFDSDQISVRVRGSVGDRPHHVGAAGSGCRSSIGEIAVSHTDDLLAGVEGFPRGDVLRLLARRRLARHRASQRHRAEAQGVPRRARRFHRRGP